VAFNDPRGVKGTLSVQVLVYASSAIYLNFEIHDDTLNKLSSTINVTTDLKWITLTTSVSIGTDLKVLFFNTSGQSTAKIKSIVARG
jgi:hypothetical protein